MLTIRNYAVAVALMVFALPAAAADLGCKTPGHVEDFRYTWRIRGGLRFIAGLVFPTSGVGNLRTTLPKPGSHGIDSELLITAPNGRQGGFYSYESRIDSRGARTLVSSHGYAWGSKSRTERTEFDYSSRVARIQKTTPEEVENKVRKLPDHETEFRDVLTAIYFLRNKAHTIAQPMRTSIYSDGKEYPVIFRPLQRKILTVGGTRAVALGFEIVDAPGGKKWPGGVKVWLSDDDRRIPLRIEIQQSFAALQLDLQSVQGCALIARL